MLSLGRESTNDKPAFSRIETWVDANPKLWDKWVGLIKASLLFGFLCWYICKACNNWIFKSVG